MSSTGYKVAGGTDLLTTFQNVLATTGNTFSSPSNVFYGNGSNLTGVTFANAVTTDTTQTITALKTFSGSNGGIKLESSCIRGRVDGFGFTTIPSGLTRQPIGYTINHVSPPTALPQNNSTVYYYGLPNVDAGVWLVDGTVNVMQGSAVWSTNSFLNTGYGATGGTISTNVISYWFSTSTNLGYRYPSATFIATNTDRTSQVQPKFGMYYSSAGGTYTHAIQMTKIA